MRRATPDRARGLFDEDVLSPLQGFDGESAMALMAGRDHRCAHFRVVEYVHRVGCGLLETERPGRKRRTVAPARDDLQPGARLPKRRNQDGRRIVPCSYEPKNGLAARRGWLGVTHPAPELSCLAAIRLRVAEDDPHCPRTQRFISMFGLLEFEPVGNERPNPDRASAHEFEERFHIALGRPTNEAWRVVNAPPFVVGFIPAGAIGARDGEGKFAVEEVPPIEFCSVTPTKTTRPRFRLIFADCCTISEPEADAVIRTPSTPRPFVNAKARSTGSTPSRTQHASAPNSSASLQRLSLGSKASTWHPFATSI